MSHIFLTPSAHIATSWKLVIAITAGAVMSASGNRGPDKWSGTIARFMRKRKNDTDNSWRIHVSCF